MDPSSELRNPEKVFYPLAIRAKVIAPTLISTVPHTQPTHAEDPPPAPTNKAPTTSIIAKDVPPSGKALFSIEAPVSVSQPSAEG